MNSQSAFRSSPDLAQARGLRLGLFTSLALCAAALVLIQAAASQKDALAQDETSNVLIIISDDMGVETLASYGIGQNPANTPVLDELAASGLIFEQAWAYPICTPFRAAALTGRFGFRTGVGTVGDPVASELPMAETILPEALDARPDLGIAHAAIGKWHVGGGRRGPNNHGFSHYAGLTSGGVQSYYDWTRNVNGQSAQETGYTTSVMTDDAIDWIGQQGQEPWFMWLAFNAPHTPFHRPPEDLHTVDLPNADPEGMGVDARPFYLAAIEAMDTEIGRLLNSMDPAVRQQTTVFFMGDNGSPARAIDAPFDRNASKGSLLQGGLRTPLIVSGAAVEAAGRRVPHPVHSVDLFATSLDLLGLPAEDWPVDIDGQSLRPYLQSADAPAFRDWAFSEKFGSEGPGPNHGKAIRDLRYKYIRYDDGTEAFHDLERDPYEARELIAAGLNGEQEAALDALRGRLDALLAGPPMTATPAAPAPPTATASATATLPPSPAPPDATPTSLPPDTPTSTGPTAPPTNLDAYIPSLLRHSD